MSVCISHALNLNGSENAQRVFLSGLLHDTGKLFIKKEILEKTETLTIEEYSELLSHPVKGFNLVKTLTDDNFILDGVLYHHELPHGNGYPFALTAEDIPIFAKVVGIADKIVAMLEDRPYREGRLGIDDLLKNLIIEYQLDERR